MTIEMKAIEQCFSVVPFKLCCTNWLEHFESVGEILDRGRFSQVLHK